MNNTQKPHGRWVVPTFIVFVLVAFSVVLGPNLIGNLDISRLSGAAGIESPSEASPSPSSTVSDDRQVVLDLADQVMRHQGFSSEDYTVDTVDTSKDKSAAAPGRFNEKPLRTPQEVTDFLKSGTPQAKAVLKEGIAQTGATRKELQDPANWVSIQFTGTAVHWGGNTYYADGKLRDPKTGRNDAKGTVGVLFIPPQQVATGKVTSVFMLRGACANPQLVLPIPAKPSAPITPPDEVCIKPERPGPGYTYDKTTCKWSPPPTKTTPPGKKQPPPDEKPCPVTEKPSGGRFEWNPKTCTWYKPAQSFDEQQNQGPAVQAPQDNSTAEENGVNTGTTPGAPATAPKPKPVYSPPPPSKPTAPAPPPTSGGSDSGGGAGSAPGGTTTDPDGSTSSGGQPGTSNPVDTGQGGDNGIGDDGESDGSGSISEPDW